MPVIVTRVLPDKKALKVYQPLGFCLIGGTSTSCQCQRNFPQAYRKVPKFSDARKLCCNLPKIQEKRPNLWIFVKKKDAN